MSVARLLCTALAIGAALTVAALFADGVGSRAFAQTEQAGQLLPDAATRSPVIEPGWAPSDTTASASEIPQPAPNDPRLFDLALAQNELDAIEREADEIRNEIAGLIEGIEGLRFQREFLELNGPARGDALDVARASARNLAVASYVGVGQPMSGLDLLDAQTASEMSWRNALLRQQTTQLSTIAETYAVLAGEADADVLALTGEISDDTRRLEALNRQLAGVTRTMSDAEWFVSIAEIHSVADGEFADRPWRHRPSADQWRRLRNCESTQTYNIDSGNTFYGAYQFTWDTWETVGGIGNPALAPAAEQDARARLLYSRRGDQPWPICGRFVKAGG